MDILLFPVKRLSWLLLLTGCGYQPIYASSHAERWCVRAAPPQIADFGAVDGALQGARSELSRAGLLATGSSHPCLMVELLRVEETATGMRLEPTGGRDQARGRGSAVFVVGRGWLAAEPNGVVSRDTGDMTRAARVAFTPSAVSDSAHHRATVRSAAEALGRAIARRVLGLPEPTHEAP